LGRLKSQTIEAAIKNNGGSKKRAIGDVAALAPCAKMR
jgi:hypothetical protein